MATISKDNAIKILHQKKVGLFTISDAKKFFNKPQDNTLYKILQRLEKAEIIERIAKGKYQFLLKEIGEFELANFLTVPSYISLESALSFYGILPQFLYTVTSVTAAKSKKIIVKQKEYEFAHIEKKYFFDFVKQDNFLIASPEKALLDELYFMAKKLRRIHLDDLSLDRINKKRLKELAKKYNFLPLQNLVNQLIK